MKEYDFIWAKMVDLAFEYGPKLIGAVLVLLFGWLIIGGISRGFGRMLDKRQTDPTLRPFLKSVVDTILKVLLVVVVLGILGIEMASIIAMLGAAGLAIGLALSGTLQNFAGGMIILLFKPFKVGDFITGSGHSGTVFQIQIFSTILKTVDNKTIILPNSDLATGSIINFSTEQRRRVDWTFSIAYGDNYSKAKEVLLQLCAEDTRIINEPEVFVGLTEMADSSINIVVRAWVEAVNYWPVHFDMNEKVYKTFDEQGLSIPFPQLDVHLRKEEAAVAQV